MTQGSQTRPGLSSGHRSAAFTNVGLEDKTASRFKSLAFRGRYWATTRTPACPRLTQSVRAKLVHVLAEATVSQRTRGRQRVRKIRTRARYEQRRLQRISRTASLGGLFLSFLKIGLTGFGGGLAVLTHIRHIVVIERRWLSEQDFVEALALGQSLPGTSAGNAVTYIGFRLRGWRGAAVSLTGFILPSMLMMIALAILYDRFRALPNTEQLFHGFNAAVVALIAVTAWRMARHTSSKPWQRILIVLAFAAVVLLKATVLEVILISGIVGIGIESFTERRLPRLERIRGFANRRQQRIRARLTPRKTRKPHRFFGGYLTEAMAEERLRKMSDALVAQVDDDENGSVEGPDHLRGIIHWNEIFNHWDVRR